MIGKRRCSIMHSLMLIEARCWVTTMYFRLGEQISLWHMFSLSWTSSSLFEEEKRRWDSRQLIVLNLPPPFRVSTGPVSTVQLELEPLRANYGDVVAVSVIDRMDNSAIVTAHRSAEHACNSQSLSSRSTGFQEEVFRSYWEILKRGRTYSQIQIHFGVQKSEFSGKNLHSSAGQPAVFF